MSVERETHACQHGGFVRHLQACEDLKSHLERGCQTDSTNGCVPATKQQQPRLKSFNQLIWVFTQMSGQTVRLISWNKNLQPHDSFWNQLDIPDLEYTKLSSDYAFIFLVRVFSLTICGEHHFTPSTMTFISLFEYFDWFMLGNIILPAPLFHFHFFLKSSISWMAEPQVSNALWNPQ